MCASPCRGTIGDSRQIKADSVLCTCMCVYACFLCVCVHVLLKKISCTYVVLTCIIRLPCVTQCFGFPQKTGEELMLVAYDLIVLCMSLPGAKAKFCMQWQYALFDVARV